MINRGPRFRQLPMASAITGAVRIAASVCLVLLSTILPMKVYGQEDPYQGYDEAAFMDMDFDQNIDKPTVGSDEHEAVRRYMTKLAREMAGKKYAVELMRGDEVMVITIPTDELFHPNDTLLMSKAQNRLSPLLVPVKDPDMFKMVYAVHTDNTGSPGYNMSLSHKRNNTIYDWLLDHVSEDLIVIPFEFGDTHPVQANNSRKGRAANRRLEFYYIPGPKMIEKARKGTLK